MKNWKYILAVFLGGCSFGMLAPTVKLAYTNFFEFPQVVSAQFTFGFLFIWLITLFSKKEKLTIKQIGLIILAGTPMGITGIFYYTSLQYVDASLGIILLFQFIWIGTLLDWILFKKIPTKGAIIAIIITLLGSVLASGLLGSNKGFPEWQGLIFGMLAAFSFSTFITVSGSVAKELPPLQKSALFATGGFIVTFILFPPTFFVDMTILPKLAPYGIFLGLFGVFLPPLLFSYGMPHVGLGLGTILSAAELPVTLVMSIFLLSEIVMPLQWVGAILILLGIMVGNLSFSKEQINTVKAQI